MRGRVLARLIAVTLGSTLVLQLVVLPPMPAGATDTDLVYAAPSGWTASASGTCPTSAACDGDDATGLRTDDYCDPLDLGHGGTHYYCLSAVAFTRTSGVTTFDVNSFRALVLTCQN